MLCLLNTECFDEELTEKIKVAEKKIFLTDKIKRGNRLSIYARVLLGYMLKTGHGIDNFSYSYGEKGKPYLENSDLFFSISHSGKYVLCCLSENEVGCDIEQIKDYSLKVAKRFFSAKEYALLENNTSDDYVFTRLWTLKESILKKDGTGISGGLDKYCFADCVCENNFSVHGCNFLCASVGEYMLSVCSEGKITEPVFVTKDEFERYIISLI